MIGYTSVGSGSSIVPVYKFDNCPPEITLHHLHARPEAHGSIMVDRGFILANKWGSREDKGRRGPRRPRRTSRTHVPFLESDADEHFSGDYLNEAMILQLPATRDSTRSHPDLRSYERRSRLLNDLERLTSSALALGCRSSPASARGSGAAGYRHGNERLLSCGLRRAHRSSPSCIAGMTAAIMWPSYGMSRIRR